MLNKTEDEVFSTEGTRVVFDAIPGHDKRLAFWDGDHDDWAPGADRRIGHLHHAAREDMSRRRRKEPSGDRLRSPTAPTRGLWSASA